MIDAYQPTFRRVIQDKPEPYNRYGPTCDNDCGRHPSHGARFCRSCLTAFRKGYYLSPAPTHGDGCLPGREEKILLYAERAANKQPLFG